MTDCALSPTLKKESRNLSVNWMKLFAPRYFPEVKERNLGADFSSPARKFGRKFRRLLKVLSNHVTQGRKTLSQHTQACLCDNRKLLTQNIPRKIEASQAEVLHIYVDASFDYLVVWAVLQLTCQKGHCRFSVLRLTKGR